MASLHKRLLALLSMLAVGACNNATSPDLTPIVGTYVFQSVSGRGTTAAGSVVLSWNGDAEQRIRYRLGDGSLSAEQVYDGYFTASPAGGLQEIGLRQDVSGAVYVFKPIVNLSDGVLTLRYADAADGPDIVETYKRQ